MILGQFLSSSSFFLRQFFLSFQVFWLRISRFFFFSPLFHNSYQHFQNTRVCCFILRSWKGLCSRSGLFLVLCRTQVIETVQTFSLLLESSQSSGIFGYFSPNNYITFFFYCNCNECTAVLTANAKNNTIYEFSLPITQISSSSHVRSLLNYLTVFRFVVWAQASIINHFVLKYHIFVWVGIVGFFK